MNSVIQQCSLYFSQGSSDKEYHAEIICVDGGYLVNFRYGRRGGSLQSGCKTPAPVDLELAQQIFNKLMKEKTAKGYTASEAGVPYQHTVAEQRRSDFVPQLSNAISAAEADLLIANPAWLLQQKMDGERRAAHAEEGKVFGMNRKGLAVPLPQAIADELLSLTEHGAIRVDGELIGETLFVFDLLIYQSKSLHDLGCRERIKLAELALQGCQHLQVVPIAYNKTSKTALWQQVLLAQGEGLVFKRIDSPVTAGRPNSGGDWLKYKFTESASCLVLAVNDGKRSVQLGLVDATQQIVNVGNVTIPVNHAIPATGEVIEVRYLYAFQGGCLFQPVYLGKHEDVDAADCLLSQLKYKPNASTGDGHGQ